MVKATFFTEFNHPRPKVDFSKTESMTRQEFQAEANVNNLLKRYALTGSFYDPLTMAKASRQPLFGDFTHFADFQAAQNAIIEAREAFDALPVEVRERFNYDPGKLIAFLQDEKNRDEAIKLGLIDKPVEPVRKPVEPVRKPVEPVRKAAGAATPVSGPDDQGAAEPSVAKA